MSNVIDLNAARFKKQVREDLAKGRTPLYVSYKTGNVTTGEQVLKPKEDFGDKLGKVKQSLERINNLMDELRKLNATKQV